jgi:hypothetical protein
MQALDQSEEPRASGIQQGERPALFIRAVVGKHMTVQQHLSFAPSISGGRCPG